MARRAFTSSSTLIGSSCNALAAVLVSLVCWKPAVCVSSVNDVCPRDPRSHDEQIWNDNPSTVNVTVVWTVELVKRVHLNCWRRPPLVGILTERVIIRPQRMHRLSVSVCLCLSVCLSACLSVCLSVCRSQQWALQKRIKTDQDAVWVVESGGSKEPCIRRGHGSPRGRGQFGGGVVSLLKCIRLCKQQTPQQHGAAE